MQCAQHGANAQSARAEARTKRSPHRQPGSANMHKRAHKGERAAGTGGRGRNRLCPPSPDNGSARRCAKPHRRWFCLSRAPRLHSSGRQPTPSPRPLSRARARRFPRHPPPPHAPGAVLCTSVWRRLPPPPPKPLRTPGPDFSRVQPSPERGGRAQADVRQGVVSRAVRDAATSFRVGGFSALCASEHYASPLLLRASKEGGARRCPWHRGRHAAHCPAPPITAATRARTPPVPGSQVEMQAQRRRRVDRCTAAHMGPRGQRGGLPFALPAQSQCEGCREKR